MSPLDRTVLVVEDHDLNRKLFHDVLEAGGYNVLHWILTKFETASWERPHSHELRKLF